MRLTVLVATTVVTACGPNCPEGDGIRVRFDPTLAERGSEAATWLAFPFPADFRRTETGTIAMSDFPNPENSGLLRDYIRHAEAELDGFGTNGAIYVAFDRPLDVSRLTTNPTAYLSHDGPLQLIDVTPSSPEYGSRRPLVWEYWSESGIYVTGGTLAVAPAWGFPLRERTTYALILTDSLRGTDGSRLQQTGLSAWLVDRSADAECFEDDVSSALRDAVDGDYAPLRKRLEQEGFDTETIGAATVFTTQDVTKDLRAIHVQIHDDLPAPPYRDNGWQEIGGTGLYHTLSTFQWNSTSTVAYNIMEGRYTAPNYRHGTLPFASPRDGGGFLFENGVPVAARSEDMRFVLTIPVDPPADGGACYPIVMYSHGTTGDAYGFSYRTAGRLAARGLACIGIDQPLHGTRAMGRSFDVSLMSFNYFNPASVRANFRQAAIDTFSLTRFVRESLIVPASKSPTGADICFDPTRVSYFGHSQGGITGALAAAFEADADPWIFSGAGGAVAITAMERNDFADIKELLKLLLYLTDTDEPMTEMHPTVRLLQTLAEVTDPINYGPYWHDLPGLSPPHHVFVTSGVHDVATPVRSANAMAVASRTPIVAPVAVPIPEYDWLGLLPADAPVSANVEGKTAGFMQWTNDIPGADVSSHFVIFNRPEAINASMRFLESAAYEGGPILERVVGADVL
ncbi:MAG: hypothetical protein V3T05_10320 [Myxococcota bacterium]